MDKSVDHSQADKIAAETKAKILKAVKTEKPKKKKAKAKK